MKKIKEFFSKKIVKAAIGMTIGSIIYCAAVVFILDLGEFYAGGITGVAQIVETLLARAFDVDVASFSGFKSIFIAALNLPLFLIGWKGVSKRFAILSLGSVIVQTIFIAIFELIRNTGFNPMEGVDRLTLSIVGGLVSGVGLGMPLAAGASTGGMDIISQYYSFKKKASFAKISFSIDLAVILVAGLIGGVITAIYTVIRLIIGVLVLDKIHTIYKFVKISIVTEDRESMRETLITKMNHGVTIYEVTGGYSNSPKSVLEIIVSSYEIEEYKEVARLTDPKCFITYTAIKNIDGLFNQKTIA